jgi:tetraacyldisaccharide 4'-kinase
VLELLRLPAWGFALAAGLRSRLYECGLLRTRRAGVPVFSVGNISAGGTGKTPMVLWLARALEQRGRKVGLLSRGYGARSGQANDEARMLATQMPSAAQVIDPDRVRGARRLLAREVDAIVLDDGFQHRRLGRDVDVVLVDATRPWGLARDADGASVCALLPRGLLRESPRALARADALVLTRVDQVPAEWLADLARELEQLAPGVPQVHTRHAPRQLRSADGSRRPASSLAGSDVDLISGIGNPESFAARVRSLGARVHEQRRFPDHHVFIRADVAGLGEHGRLTLCTEKDAPKLADLQVACSVLEIELELLSGAPALEALLDAALDAEKHARAGSRLL